MRFIGYNVANDMSQLRNVLVGSVSARHGHVRRRRVCPITKTDRTKTGVRSDPSPEQLLGKRNDTGKRVLAYEPVLGTLTTLPPTFLCRSPGGTVSSEAKQTWGYLADREAIGARSRSR